MAGGEIRGERAGVDYGVGHVFRRWAYTRRVGLCFRWGVMERGVFDHGGCLGFKGRSTIDMGFEPPSGDMWI